MANSGNRSAPPPRIHILVAIAGVAALSWEVIWQIKSSLALGVSAWGTALTLAATMGGMSLGALSMGHVLKNRVLTRPVRLYGILEIIIGIAGLFLGATFQAVENLDTWAYSAMPEGSSLIHIGGIVASLGVPTICMGASLPVFGLLARQFRTSIAALYGLNTLGAAAGALIAAFILIPEFGVTHASWLVSAINIAVGILTWKLGPGDPISIEDQEKAKPLPQLGSAAEQLVVLVTGYATFSLEVAWFRSLTAAFKSTTAAFAIMLASVLIALGMAARLVPLLKQRKVPIGLLVTWAGILILLMTPIIERFDLFVLYRAHAVKTLPTVWTYSSVTALFYVLLVTRWFMMTLYAVGAPILFLGLAFPWIIDDRHSPRRWGILYALNTLAAIAGSISAAWLFLPTIGASRTAWVAGVLVVLTGVIIAPSRKRIPWGLMGIAALLIAVMFESGIGTKRVQGNLFNTKGNLDKILEFYEGPQATVAAIQYENGISGLVVDGFLAASQKDPSGQYMAWMGHLPMLLQPDPQNALVICFGTGQTANAVRNENPKSLDIVDINPQVFKLAHNFTTNEGVLNDPRVRAIAMDGRAYMRRSRKTYDVITLEPMPPTFAGVNALYSREFYELARARLSPNGVMAQWLPFHLIAPHYGAAIAKTFQDVFPNAILWIDPASQTGILLGTKDDSHPLGTTWPGFKRTDIKRNLSEDEIKKAVMLNPDEMRKYSDLGEIIDDDNQLLAYGNAVKAIEVPGALQKDSIDLLESLKQGAK